jgi:hypothetical protein
MTTRSRPGEMFLGKKSGKVVNESHLALEMGCGFGVSVWSMRSLLDSELRERGRQWRALNPKRAVPDKVQKLAKKLGQIRPSETGQGVGRDV